MDRAAPDAHMGNDIKPELHSESKSESTPESKLEKPTSETGETTKTPKSEETAIDLPNKTVDLNNGKIFISYLTWEAGKLARLLDKKLRELGQDVFFAQESLLSGCVYPDILNQEVRQRDIFVPLVTKDYGKHSSNQSKWCLSELTTAYNLNKKLKPIIIIDWTKDPYPPEHIALQLGIFQAVHWLPLKECQDEVGNDYSQIKDKWPEKCLDIIARTVAGIPLFKSKDNMITMK